MLVALFDKNGVENPSFKFIFNEIYKRLQEKYDIEHEQGQVYCFGCPGGGSNFQLYNSVTKKSIVLSYWDRGMNIFDKHLGWEDYTLVQYIGGIGMWMNSTQIQNQYNVIHTPHQYPLGTTNAYRYIDQFRKEYIPENLIRKAIFIGSIYGTRSTLAEYLKGHPLIEILDKNYNPQDYFSKISEYRLGLSFNGNGEVSMRDFELMGLGIPIIRSDIKTAFLNPLIPNYHYLRVSEACVDACYNFSNVDLKNMAESYVYLVEKFIDSYETLNLLSKRGTQYYDNYCHPEYMVDLFMKHAKIDLIL